jgi:hypothetical protein
MAVFEMFKGLKKYSEIEMYFKNKYNLKFCMNVCAASAIVRLLSLLLWFG